MIRLFQAALLLSTSLTFGFKPLSPHAATSIPSQRRLGQVIAAASTSTLTETAEYVVTSDTAKSPDVASMPSPYHHASVAWAELRRGEIQEHHHAISTTSRSISDKAVAGPVTLEEENEAPPSVTKAMPRGLAYSKATTPTTTTTTSAPFLSTDDPIEELEQELTTEQGLELRGLAYSKARLALLEKKIGVVLRGLAYSKARLAMVEEGLAWNGNAFPSPPLLDPTEEIILAEAPEARGLSYSNSRSSLSMSTDEIIATMADQDSAAVASSPSTAQEDETISQHEEVQSLMEVYSRGYY